MLPVCGQFTEWFRSFQPLLSLHFTIDLMLLFIKLLVILVGECEGEMSEAKGKKQQS